ncbi:hypothetical protein FOZ60_003817 [Perkinsus olseni]|uniref:Uncharacterized protein n=1 Tax=Perkinsus olseni TaxID=32597 RepID=A0A7J6NVF9_PEROL|nr:hypothetical protein FOZ60_003817 [Perkinsus olseni]
MTKPDGSPAFSSASNGPSGSPSGPLRVTRKSTAAEVLGALKPLTFLGSITVDFSFADVNGEMLLQMGSPTALKELVPTIPPRAHQLEIQLGLPQVCIIACSARLLNHLYHS